MRHRSRSPLWAVVAVACSSAAPSRTPLAPPRPEPPRAIPASSRFIPPEEQAGGSSDEGPSVELQIDDDDDDDSTGRVSSSSAKAPACSFHETPRPDCRRLESSGLRACSGSIAERACETWGPHLDAKVAELWVSCLSDPKPGAAACSSAETLRCVTAAVGAACTDGSYRARCLRIAEACSDTLPELTAPLCEHVIAAFSPKKREPIADCLDHGCNTGAFGSCIP